MHCLTPSPQQLLTPAVALRSQLLASPWYLNLLYLLKAKLTMNLR